jgi:hypothetical protein
MVAVAAYMIDCHDIVILRLTIRCDGCREVKVGVKVTV